MNQLDNFMGAYAPTFKKMYGVSDADLIQYYNEDTYSGYPDTPGGSAWRSEMKSIYCSIRILKPQNILEIGNFMGHSANHILLAVEKNRFGNVTLLDLAEQIDYDNIHNRNFTRVVQDSIIYLKTNTLSHDFYIIDGCHSYSCVKQELRIIQQKSTVDINIWSHDYYAKIVPGIRQAWNEEGSNFDHFYPLIDNESDCGFVLASKKITN